MDVEKKIRELLELKRISVRELCKKIGMSDVNLYRRFKANSIETKHLEKIAQECQVDLLYFFTENEPEVPKKKSDPELIREYILSSKITAYNHNSIRETNAMMDFLLSVDFNDPRDHKRIIDKVQSLAFRFGVILDNIVEFNDLEEKIKKYNPELYKEMFFDAKNNYLRTPNLGS